MTILEAEEGRMYTIPDLGILVFVCNVVSYGIEGYSSHTGMNWDSHGFDKPYVCYPAEVYSND